MRCVFVYAKFPICRGKLAEHSSKYTLPHPSIQDFEKKLCYSLSLAVSITHLSPLPPLRTYASSFIHAEENTCVEGCFRYTCLFQLSLRALSPSADFANVGALLDYC